MAIVNLYKVNTLQIKKITMCLIGWKFRKVSDRDVDYRRFSLRSIWIGLFTVGQESATAWQYKSEKVGFLRYFLRTTSWLFANDEIDLKCD